MAEVQEEAVMSKEHRKILRKHRMVLEENLQPLKLLSHLTDILFSSDEEDIRAEKTSTEQTVRLLDILPKKGSKAFEAFVRALEKKQRFLAIPIAEEAGLELSSSKDGYNEHYMQSEHKEILRSNRGVLQEIIHLKNVLELMGIVFDKEDIEQIQSKPTKNERFTEFISILTKKEDKAFHHFVKVVKILHPGKEKFLIKDENNLDKTDKNDLKHPTPIVNPVDDTVVSKLMGNLSRFCQETDQNDQWKRLARYLQVPLEKVQHLPNPTYKVINEWSSAEGENATVSKLKAGLTYLGMEKSLGSLESDLINPIDHVDSPVSQVTALVQKTENMTIDVSKRPKDVKTFGDLSKENQKILLGVIEKEINKLRNEGQFHYENVHYENLPQLLIRGLTSMLRERQMYNSIKWMKNNLPSGITGPIFDENFKVRDIPYSVRSKLTMELCANDNWKRLAEYFGLSNVEINFFDSHRFKNPADEVLKQWETKRNTTVGELYDILVELNMPVIADSTL